MADKTDDLVIGVSTDLSSVQRAIKKLDGDIARAGSQIERQFAKVGQGIDKAMPSSIQDRINKMVGVQAAATKEWTGALASQGKEMDRLRAKFSPMFSTITSYKSAIGEIRAAHRLGAISADEMASAIQRERQAALASIAAIKGRNAALADTPVAMAGRGASNFNTANIAAQLQDIGVMAQMGVASPLTIALQQGTQLSAVFNQMGGARDIIKGIGAAFLSIVNPVSLVTIGTIAAGVAAYNYFSEAEDGAANTQKALKEQADLIQRVAQKWGEALPAIRAYANEQDRLAGNAAADASFKKLANDTFGKIKDEVSSAGNAIQDVMDLLKVAVPTEQIVAIQRAFSGLSESAAKNKTTVEELDAAHRALMNAFQSENIPVLKAAADALAALRPELVDTTVELERLAAQKDVTKSFENLQAAIGNISSAKAREELNALLEQAKTSEISVDDLVKKLAEISGYAPDVSGIVAAFVAVAKAAASAAQTSASVYSRGGPLTRGRYGRYPQLPETAPTPTRRMDPYFEDWRTKEKAVKAPKRTADDRFFEDIEAIKQRTIALAEERAQLGLSYEAQQKRRVAFDLEQKALKDVREAARQKGDQDWQNAQLTPDQIRQIDEVSGAYARQAAELRKSHEQRQFWEDSIYGLFTDLIPAIETGNKALDNFLNTLMQVAAQSVLLGKGPFGGGGGGLIGSLLGGIGIPGFASGTANTGGSKGQPIGLVHGQEAVIPLPGNGKVPVQIQAPVAPRFSDANQTNGRMHVTVGVDVDGNGNLLPFVKSVSQGEAQRSTAQLGRSVPKMVDSTNRDMRVRNRRP